MPQDFFDSLEKYRDEAVDDLPLHPSETKPDWYSAELLARGQQFIRKHYTNVSFSQLVSLYIVFAFKEILDTLIYTRESDTVESATIRYYKTVMRVKSWGESDPWDKSSEAYRNVVIVRSLHSRASRILNSKGKYVVEKELRDIKTLWENSCPLSLLDQPSLLGYPPKGNFLNSKKFINQPQMSLTLFGFMGLTLLYPEKLGIFGASDEELVGFIHFWRNIGHLLGIEDDVNLCRGSLAEVKERCHALLTATVLPSLAQLDANWEHMSKCMIQGATNYLYFVDYETTLLYLFWVLGMKCDNLKKRASIWSLFKFYVSLFVVLPLQRIPVFKELMNSLVKNTLDEFGKSEAFQRKKKDLEGDNFSLSSLE